MDSLLSYTLIVIIIIALLLAGVQMSVKNKSKINTVYIGVGTLFAFASIWFLWSTSKKKQEHFIDDGATLNKILSIIGIQNSMNTADLTKVAENITTMGSDYNENLQQIQTGLTIYYSAFSKKSFPTISKTWNNISPFFLVPNKSCPDVQYEITHANFSQPPTYSRESGFSLGKLILQGPKSHELGISGNSSFTIFFTARFTSFEATANANANESNYEILKIFANTPNNNGLTLFIPENKKTTTDSSTYNVTIGVQYGTQTVYGEDPKTKKPDIVINTGFTYMFVIVKDGLDLTLHIFPNIDNISSNPQSRNTIINKFKLSSQQDVLFSNKEMVINRNANVYTQIFNFGTYNRGLDDNAIASVFIHTQTELHKSNQLLKDLATQIQLLRSQVNQLKACPYDVNVCTQCKDIKDWTNITDVLGNANDGCLTSINEFCKKNPKHPQCRCWDASNSISKTKQCTNYVNIFTKANIITPDNIDNKSLENIKNTHNLCSCAELESLKKILSDSLAASAVSQASAMPTKTKKNNIVRPATIPLDGNVNEYNVKPENLNIYNAIGINNYLRDVKPTKKRYRLPQMINNPFLLKNPTPDY